MSQRKTWSCNPGSPTATVSSQGTAIGRRTAELVRTTGSYLSVRQFSRRSTDRTSSIIASTRTSIDQLQVSRAEEQSTGDIIRELGEGLDIVEDSTNSLEVVQPEGEPDTLKTENSDKDVKLQGLRTAMLEARVETIEGQHFIPISLVNELLTEQRVKEELMQSLSEASSHELDEICQQVCSQPNPNAASSSLRFLRVFAILVLIGRSADIREFIRSGISDKDLPLSEKQLQQTRDGETSTERRAIDLPHWDSELKEKFVRYQWEINVPFFSQSESPSKIRFYKLDAKTILPFTNDKTPDSIYGGFSEVSKVKIHSSHHNFIGISPKSNLAVKRFKNDDSGTFVEELRALQRFYRPQNRHHHLISPIATFQRGNKYFIMFEWAAGGDLRQFWKANKPPIRANAELDLWMVKQCLGLADALASIHKIHSSKSLYGRHGDLKPENILCFEDADSPIRRTRLVISDVGLTRFHHSAEGQHSEQRHTPTYRAPEFDLENGVTSRSYDIWSLGCLFLEFVTWYLTGSSGIDDKFTEVRTTEGLTDVPDDNYFLVKRDYVDDTLRAEVKPSVTKWINELRRHPNCVPFLQRMLDVVETRINLYGHQQLESGGKSEAKHFIDSQLNRTRSQIGIGNLRLEILDEKSKRISTFDTLRLQIEHQLGHKLDWSPLPGVNRCPASAEARLVWNYGGMEVAIFLDHNRLKRYRDRIHVSTPAILPTMNATKSTSRGTRTTLAGLQAYWQYIRLGVSKTLQSWKRSNATKNNTTVLHPTVRMTASTGKESYFCIDKHWTSVKQTSMYTVPGIDQLEDDHQLFLALGKCLEGARGSWMHRWSSWRTCTGVQLSKFTFLFDNCDLVKAFEKGMNERVQEICKGYDYSCLPELDPDEHMQLMAETILQGLQEPERGQNSRAVLDGIPKLQAPPGIDKRQFNSGWGFYTSQGYCLMKILLWVGAILSPGVAFVIAWLCLVNAFDLQNAFVPMMFLAGNVAIILASLLMCAP
ncbi:protein kinase [Colletotrichum truncatum]|uniref:Protein kinase n=1 Tax=Colletotrichum truncatum TaxID=5467 RepID=A0ACC3ZD16_COLTU